MFTPKQNISVEFFKIGDNMIFVALGTQKFPFNRLLKELDLMSEEGKIKDEVVAQTGYSTYIPKMFKFTKFLSVDEYNKNIKKCDLLITHAGVGTILEGKKLNKPIIVVPRLSKYGEHVDDHQLEIAEDFAKKKLVFVCRDTNELDSLIKESKKNKLMKYVSNNKDFVLKLKSALANI